MSNPPYSTVGNGCSLEDCYTNVFSISDFRDIQFCKYTYSQPNASSLSSSAGDCPLLKTYTNCISAELLCTWNRVKPSSNTNDGTTLQDFSQPYKFTQFDLELWVWWHGDVQPACLSSLIAPGVKESKRGGWNNGLEYDCRTAYFKALYERLERFFLVKGYLRMNEWYVPCSRTLNSYSADNLEYSMGFHFFLHGESTVCVTLDIRQMRRLRHLLPSDLHTLHRQGPNARLPVKLAPYAHNALLCATTHSHPQSREQEEVRLAELYRRWREFYNLPFQSGNNQRNGDTSGSNIEDMSDLHEDNDVSKLPNMVEVIVATHRMFYPSFLVMLAVEPSASLSSQNVNSSNPKSDAPYSSNRHDVISVTSDKMDVINPLKRKKSSNHRRRTCGSFSNADNGMKKYSPSLLSLLSQRSHQHTLQDIVVMLGSKFCKDLLSNSSGESFCQNILERHINCLSKNGILLEPNSILPCRCRRHNRRGDKRRRQTNANGSHQSLRQHFTGHLINDTGHCETVDADHGNSIIDNTADITTGLAFSPSNEASTFLHKLSVHANSVQISANYMEYLCSRRKSPPPSRPPFPCDQPDLTMPTLSPQQAEPSGICNRTGMPSKLCDSMDEAMEVGESVISRDDVDRPIINPDDEITPIPFTKLPLQNLGIEPVSENVENYSCSETLANGFITDPVTSQSSSAMIQPQQINTSNPPVSISSNGGNKNGGHSVTKLLSCWLFRECLSHMQVSPYNSGATAHASNSKTSSINIPQLEVNPLEYEYWYDNSFHYNSTSSLPLSNKLSNTRATLSTTSVIPWSGTAHPPPKVPRLERTSSIPVDISSVDGKTRTVFRSEISAQEEEVYFSSNNQLHPFQSRGTLFKPNITNSLTRYPYQYQHHRAPLLPLTASGASKLGPSNPSTNGYEPSICMLPTPPSNEMLNQPMLSPATSAVLLSASSGLGLDNLPLTNSARSLFSVDSCIAAGGLDNGHVDPGILNEADHFLNYCLEFTSPGKPDDFTLSSQWRFLRNLQLSPIVGSKYRPLCSVWKEAFPHPDLVRSEKLSFPGENVTASANSSPSKLNSHSSQLSHLCNMPFSNQPLSGPLASGHHNHSLSLSCIATNLPSTNSSSANTPSKSFLRAANSHQSALPSGAPLGCYTSSSAAGTPLGTPYPQQQAQASPWQGSCVGSNSHSGYLSMSAQSSNLPYGVGGNPLSNSQQQRTPGPSSIHSLSGLHVQPYSAGAADSISTAPNTNMDRFSNHPSVGWPIPSAAAHSASLMGNSSVPSVSQQRFLPPSVSATERYMPLREADSLWFITILSDSLFNVVKDHNFDTSCNICECSRAAMGSEIGLYVAYQSSQSAKNKPLSQTLSAAASCKCAFSALANRRRAGVSNLFYEDEVDIIGDRTERVSPPKITMWNDLLSPEELLPTAYHSSHLGALPHSQLLQTMFGQEGPFIGLIEEFSLRTMLRLHRLEQSVALHLTRTIHKNTESFDSTRSYISEGVPVNTLQYNDATLWSLLALEQSTLTADGTIQPYNGTTVDLHCEPIAGDVERRNLTTWNILSRHFHRLIPADIPDSCNDQIRLLKTVRPWLQEALGATRRMEYAYTVEGPLTWAAFHKLAGRGFLETCEPQPVAQLQMAVAQHPYSLLGSGGDQQIIPNETGTVSNTLTPTSTTNNASGSSNSSTAGSQQLSHTHHKPSGTTSNISMGRSPLNELLQLMGSEQSTFSLSPHSRPFPIWCDSSDPTTVKKLGLSTLTGRKESFPSVSEVIEEHAGLVLSPYAVPLWSSLNLAPYSKPKDVAYLLIAPNESRILRACTHYLRQLKHTYEHCHLGRFRPFPDMPDMTDKLPGVSLPDQGILPVTFYLPSVFHGEETPQNMPFSFSHILCNVDLNNPRAEQSEEWIHLIEGIKNLLSAYVESICKQMKIFVAHYHGKELSTLQQAFQQVRLSFNSMVHGYHRLSSHAKRLMSLFPYSEGLSENVPLNNMYLYNQNEDEIYVTVYIVNPFSLAMDEVATELQKTLVGSIPTFSATKYSPLARLVTQALMTCVYKCRQLMPPCWRERCNFHIVPLDDLISSATSFNIENDALSPERLFTMALATYSTVDRLLIPSLRPNYKCALARITPAAERERSLMERRQQRRVGCEGLRLYAPPYILASGVHRSNISGLSGAAKPVMDSSLHTPEPSTGARFYLTSHATQREGVLLVTYCLSADLHWLLAVCTDEVGSLLQQTTINIWVPEKHRRRKASARRHGLGKLWEWIISVISGLPQAWRLIIGRFGRIGHGELLSLEGLTSRKNLQRCNIRLRHSCGHVMNSNVSQSNSTRNTEDAEGCSHCPRLLSACVTSLELHPSLRIYTGAVQQEERASSSLPITTPRDASVTHILVFPTSSCITAQQDADPLNLGASTFDGQQFPEIWNILGTDLMGQNEDLAHFFQNEIFLDMPNINDVFSYPDTQPCDINSTQEHGGGRMGESANSHNSLSFIGFGGNDPIGSHFFSNNDNGGLFDTPSSGNMRSGMDNGLSGATISQQPNSSMDQQTVNNAQKNDSDPQSEGNSLMQQPLAMGYYVSTAPTGPLPTWFWCTHTSEDPYHLGESPSSMRQTNCFLAALQLQSTLVSNHSDSTGAGHNAAPSSEGPSGPGANNASLSGANLTSNPCMPPHPLDSNSTCDVLRYVLETYNALSWLTLDPLQRERRTCLPLHMLCLLQLYHSHNAFL